jgi:hypothetical protein
VAHGWMNNASVKHQFGFLAMNLNFGSNFIGINNKK